MDYGVSAIRPGLSESGIAAPERREQRPRNDLVQKFLRIPAIALAALLGTGCAYLTTYNKQVDLAGSSAIAMDVKQRIAFSREVEIEGDDHRIRKLVVTCAEPSPDALTVIGASAGISLKAGTGESDKAIDLAGALSESGTFVGLRTQSIQLLRDQMYRLCEAYAGEGVNSAELKAMHRRFQSTVMGLLAIEQLTHPVVAAQAILTASASSAAGAGTADAAVAAAQKAVDEQRQRVTDQTAATNAKEAAVAKDKTAIQENADALVEASKGTDTSATTTLKNNAKTLQATLEADTAALDKAQLQLRQEEETLKRLQQTLREAQARAVAITGGAGQINNAAGGSLNTTNGLAKAVTDIVAEVNRSYTRDECFDLLSRLSFPPKSKKPMVPSIQSAAPNGGQPNPTSAPRLEHLTPAVAYAAPDDNKVSTDHVQPRAAMLDICRLVLTDNPSQRAMELELKKLEIQLKIEEAKRDTAKAQATEKVAIPGQVSIENKRTGATGKPAPGAASKR